MSSKRKAKDMEKKLCECKQCKSSIEQRQPVSARTISRHLKKQAQEEKNLLDAIDRLEARRLQDALEMTCVDANIGSDSVNNNAVGNAPHDNIEDTGVNYTEDHVANDDYVSSSDDSTIDVELDDGLRMFPDEFNFGELQYSECMFDEIAEYVNRSQEEIDQITPSVNDEPIIDTDVNQQHLLEQNGIPAGIISNDRQLSFKSDLHILLKDLLKSNLREVESIKKVFGNTILLVGMKHYISKSAISQILKCVSSLTESICGVSLCPSTLYQVESDFLNYWKSNVCVRVICKKCGHAYPLLNTSVQVFCSYCQFKRNVKVVCKAELYSKVKEKFVPRSLFYYFPLEASLRRLISYPNFIDNCKYGIERIANPLSDLMDIYDGSVCEKRYRDECLKYLNGELDYFPLYLIFNSDGFTAFNRSSRSSWVFNFSIANLHRSIRYKGELSIVWTVTELLSHGFSGVLDTLVEELQKVYNGIVVNGITFKAKLILVCCDVPAVRKMLGFVNFNATIPCTFCKHAFRRISSSNERNIESDNGNEIEADQEADNSLSKPDFSDFGFKTSGLKTHEELKACNVEYSQATSVKARKEVEQKYGFKTSPFFSLDYLDVMDVQSIDSMHLFGEIFYGNYFSY